MLRSVCKNFCFFFFRTSRVSYMRTVVQFSFGFDKKGVSHERLDNYMRATPKKERKVTRLFG